MFDEGVDGIHGVTSIEMQADFDNLPASTSHHFFVDTDSSNPVLVEEANGLDPTVSNPESIT